MGTGSDQSEFGDFSLTTTWIDLGMCFVCIFCAALAAGLTIGLVSIDQKELKLLTINGTKEQKDDAAKVLPLIKDHHWLLVTLFLFNAVANEALPIFLSAIVPEFVAIILATFSVLIFGEILPSSIFSGKHQLKIAARLSWVVKILLALFYVIARPIGLFLDWWLGEHTHHAPFNAKDLFTLLSLSRDPDGAPKGRFRTSTAVSNDDGLLTRGLLSSDNDDVPNITRAPSILGTDDSTYLPPDAVTIAQGAILTSRKCVRDIAQPKYYSVSSNEIVDIAWFEKVGKTGYSRILIDNDTKPADVRRKYLVVKELLCELGLILKSTEPVYVRDLPSHPTTYFAEDCRILEALNKFQSGVSRVGAVTVSGSSRQTIIGFFSLEDVLEEIIQEDINDEKDSRQASGVLLQAYKRRSADDISLASFGSSSVV